MAGGGGGGGGGGVRVKVRFRELITELILKEVSQNKLPNTADQNTFWRYFWSWGDASNRINSDERL